MHPCVFPGLSSVQRVRFQPWLMLSVSNVYSPSKHDCGFTCRDVLRLRELCRLPLLLWLLEVMLRTSATGVVMISCPGLSRCCSRE